ncbi:inner membrane protein YpjD [Desulfovibrio sp. JC022]|uniref:cytochrome C assembly family protein n=1 Tax=Desulfovibrio sp. JC022 TaxID=2593642 RepID=UPI0013CFC485|nr:cytochrome c biogenesis protein CcsA [Desulfovibrio sp. JC022]NDV24506.1 cytochrome C assembly protein [Desulfovibrio sp. JC022]
MTLFELFQYVIIALYLAGTVCFFIGSLKSNKILGKLGNLSAVGGFALHTLDLLLAVTLYKETVLSGGYFYFSLLGWSFILVYFGLWWKLRSTFFALTASPFALLLFIISLASQSLKVTIPAHLAGLFIGLHIGTIFVSIALMAMAAGAGVAFLYLNNKIKTKANLTGMGKEMPSLNTFDNVNHWSIIIGFPLYTLGLAAGFLWARAAFSKMFSWDPKEIVTLVVWFLFAFVFHQRIMMGWRGKKPAILVIIVFVITMISLWGINFFIPTHHSFKV